MKAWGLLVLSGLLVACVGDSPVATGPDGGGVDGAADTGGDTGAADASADTGPDAAAPGFYVSADTGDDTNPGTMAAPLKTLKKGLSLAKPGDNVYLLAGTYDTANGESFPESIPDGVKVLGVGAADGGSGARIQGATPTGLVFVKGGGLGNLTVSGFQTAISATQGAQNVSALRVDKGLKAVGLALDASGTADVTVNGFTMGGGGLAVKAAGTAKVAVNGASVTGGGGGGGMFSCVGGAMVSIDSITTANAAGTVVGAQDGCSITMTKGTLSNGAGTVISLASGTPSITLDTVTIDKGADGIYGGAAAAKLVMTGGAITNVSHDGITGNLSLTMDGTSITGSGRLAIEHVGGTLDIKNATLSGNAVGNIYTQGASVIMRGTTMKNAPYGLVVLGSISVDLGTTNSHGNNIIQGHSTTGVDVTIGTSNGTFQAVGNTWNANAQGADGSGHYTQGTVVSNQSGTNFKVGANQKLVL